MSNQAEAILLQIRELDAHISRLIIQAKELQKKMTSKVPAVSA